MIMTEPYIKPIPRPKSWEEALDVVPPVLTECKPLAVGIRYALQALKAPGVSNRAISRLIEKHTSRQRYLMAIITEPYRFALSGEPDSLITTQHKEHARRKLEAEMI